MTLLWIVPAFVAGSLSGAVAMGLSAAGNRAGHDSRGIKLSDNEKDTGL